MNTFECPACGNQVSVEKTHQLHRKSLGSPDRTETYEDGTCNHCSLRLSRRHDDEGKFWWAPVCRECNAELAFAGGGGGPGSVLYRCPWHRSQTWTYEAEKMKGLR